MSNVYFKRFKGKSSAKKAQKMSRELLETVVKKEKVKLNDKIPMKVHFGEGGNITFIRSENFDGIIDYLEDNDIETCFMETNVLYGGVRDKEEVHIKTAKNHGFTRVPIVIADGSHGQEFDEIKVDLKHYKTCKIGAAFGDYDQLLVLAHFKGHGIAGFGGAIKQLSMGCASKGGKLAMHMGIKPKISNRKCKKCHLCQSRCAVDAITIGDKSFIDHDKCVGCGACSAICPHKAVSIMQVQGIVSAFQMGTFREKLAEYAYAAQKGKRNIYINFIMNVTKGCDCEGKKMKVIMDDIGIMASTDPVAIDKASWDIVKENGKKFRGSKVFAYSESIGLGSAKYKLIEV